MDKGTHERQLRNRLYIVCAVAGAIIILAVSLLVLGMWLKSLFLALFGIALFMIAFALGSESENRSCLFFVLSVFVGTLALAVFVYGIYSWIF